jgi:hypothetical protein
MQESADTGTKVDRPFGVALIAALQFGRAGVLLAVTAAAFLFPDAGRGLRRFTLMVAYIAANGAQPPMVLLPLWAIFLAAIGWGLWRLKKWARWILLTSYGVLVVRWVTALLWDDWAMGETTLHTAMARIAVWTVILSDAVIFLYLVQSQIRDAFGEEGG